MSARERWAHRLIAPAPKPLPRYGSDEWLALPEGHPSKIAAVVVAAECWATEPEQLATMLRFEAEAFKRTEDAAYLARRDAHRAEWEQNTRADVRARQADTYRREVYGDDYGRTA